jgi:polysaccharide deacetylase family protein (PEP-CTERM system associated)
MDANRFINGDHEKMNILTFDLEEWHIYKRPHFGGKEYYLPVLDNLLSRLLDILEYRKLTATFFCLGIVASEYPEIIKRIANKGHEIACHSNEHYWINELTPAQFDEDTKKAISSLEDVIGKKVRGYRAPAFSIGEQTKWAFDTLMKYGIEYDCSVFPGARDFGGFPSYKAATPSLVRYGGITIKELPMTMINIAGKKIAYSGGGFFRLLPYSVIKKATLKNNYNMSYFHLRDFDAKQKRRSLFDPRYFKIYYGINGAYAKFTRYISDFDFVNVEKAVRIIDWNVSSIYEI